MATIAVGIIVHTMAVVGPSSIVQIPPAGLRFSRQHPHPSLRPDCCRYDHDRVQMNVGFPFCELILSAVTALKAKEKSVFAFLRGGAKPTGRGDCEAIGKRAGYRGTAVRCSPMRTSRRDSGRPPAISTTRPAPPPRDPSRDSRRPSDRRHQAGREPGRWRPLRPKPAPPGGTKPKVSILPSIPSWSAVHPEPYFGACSCAKLEWRATTPTLKCYLCA
jgi:hypothetical protein